MGQGLNSRPGIEPWSSGCDPLLDNYISLILNFNEVFPMGVANMKGNSDFPQLFPSAEEAGGNRGPLGTNCGCSLT